MNLFQKNTKNQIYPNFATLLVLCFLLGSCNSHQKLAKLIGNSLKEPIGKLVHKEAIIIDTKISPAEKLIPVSTISDIIAEKSELIATY